VEVDLRGAALTFELGEGKRERCSEDKVPTRQLPAYPEEMGLQLNNRENPNPFLDSSTA